MSDSATPPAARPGSDAAFAGSIPELYDTLLVPLIFEPYAADLARRAAALAPRRVLETAAGTGAVTRALALALPPACEIVATDLNPPMLERAQRIGTVRPVAWRQADALQLPFDDASFDLVVCQFGAMFFPDRPRGFAEARRVLRSGGHLLFNVWDRIEENDFADTVTQTLAPLYPADPPRFMARTPHGYFDRAALAADLAAAGFDAAPAFETVSARSRGESARSVAVAYCEGTPMRGEIEARSAIGPGLAEATAASEAALVRRFGSGPVDGRIRAIVVDVRR